MKRKGDKIGMGYCLRTDLSTLTPPTKSHNPYIVACCATLNLDSIMVLVSQ